MPTCALVHLAHRGLGGAPPRAAHDADPRAAYSQRRRARQLSRARSRSAVERLAGGAPSDHLVHDLYGGILERLLTPRSSCHASGAASWARGGGGRVCDMLRVGACEAREPPK